MPRIVQLRRGSSALVSVTVGAQGELFVDTTKNAVVVMDGATTGGTTMATEAFALAATPTATTSVLGRVRPNNSSIVVIDGVLERGSSITTNWTATQSSNGSLYFYHNGVAKMRLDSSGTITATGDVIAFGIL